MAMDLKPELAGAPATSQDMAPAAANGSSGATTIGSNGPGGGASQQQHVEYGEATAADVDAAAYLLMRAFEETMDEIFPSGCTPELLAFRRSQIVQSLATIEAYKAGTYATPTRFAVARRSSKEGSAGSPSARVIGMVMWSLESTAMPEAKARETFKPPPFGPGPPDARMDRFAAFRKGMAESEERNVGNRPRASVKYLCIDQDLRRTGAGTGLMRLVRRDALSAGDLPIYLDAAETSSAPAFYAKLGFRIVDVVSIPGLVHGTKSMLLEAKDSSPILDQDQ